MNVHGNTISEPEAGYPGDPCKTDYDEMRRNFVLVATMAGQIVDLRGTEYDPILSLNMAAFALQFSNAKLEIEGRDKKGNPKIDLIPFVEKWKNDPERLEYRGLGIWKKGEEPPGYYNLFRGYAIEAVKGRWPRIEHYLLNVLCCGDVALYSELRTIIFFVVRNVGTRAEVAIQITGGQGAGKTTLYTIFRNIFGPRLVRLHDDPDAIHQSFNSLNEFRIVIFYDEAFFAASRLARQKAKGLVTSRDIPINKKHVPQYTIPNVSFNVALSNEPAALGLDVDDRRQLVLRASEDYIGNDDYWTKLNAALDGAELSAFLYDALTADLPARLPPPNHNQARADVIAYSRGPTESYIVHLLQTAVLPKTAKAFPIVRANELEIQRGENPWLSGLTAFSLDGLHEDYRMHMKDHHPRETLITAAQLKAVMIRMLGGDLVYHTWTKTPTRKRYPVREKYWGDYTSELGGKIRGWVTQPTANPLYVYAIGSLPECRRRLESKSGPVEWDVRYDDQGQVKTLSEGDEPGSDGS
jgi:hypothetical protein